MRNKREGAKMDKCDTCGNEIDSENESAEEVMYDDICSECEGELYTFNRC
jgi:hypothetical protein